MQDDSVLLHWMQSQQVILSRKWDTVYATMHVARSLRTYIRQGTLCGKGETIEATLEHLQDILQDKLNAGCD